LILFNDLDVKKFRSVSRHGKGTFLIFLVCLGEFWGQYMQFRKFWGQQVAWMKCNGILGRAW